MFKTFVADSLSYIDAGVSTIVGHQQMTDAHLAAPGGRSRRWTYQVQSRRSPGVTPRCWRYPHLIGDRCTATSCHSNMAVHLPNPGQR